MTIRPLRVVAHGETWLVTWSRESGSISASPELAPFVVVARRYVAGRCRQWARCRSLDLGLAVAAMLERLPRVPLLRADQRDELPHVSRQKLEADALAGQLPDIAALKKRRPNGYYMTPAPPTPYLVPRYERPARRFRPPDDY